MSKVNRLTEWPKAAYAWPDFSRATQIESSRQLVTRGDLMGELVNVHGQNHSELQRAMHEDTCDAPGRYRHFREVSFLRGRLDAILSGKAQVP